MEYKIVYKDGTEKYLESLPKNKLIGGLSHPGIYRIGNDVIKEAPSDIGGMFIPSVMMTRGKAEFFMEHDETFRHVHPCGIVYRILSFGCGLVYEAYATSYVASGRKAIRDFNLSDLFYNYSLLDLDNNYYDRVGICMGDVGLHNIIRKRKSFYLHDMEGYAFGISNSKAKNDELLNELVADFTLTMIDESADESVLSSCERIDAVKSRLQVGSPIYTPFKFGKEFCHYRTMDDYLVDRGIKVKVR